MKIEYQYVTTKPTLWQRLRHGMKPLMIGYNRREYRLGFVGPVTHLQWTKGSYMSANGETIRLHYGAWVDPLTYGLPF